MKKGIFVIGEICSGKNFFIQHKIAERNSVVELGEFVREKFATVDRVFDTTLDDYLCEKTRQAIEEDTTGVVVVAGLRQVSLTQMLTELFDEVELYYLVCPRSIMRERYYARADAKDNKIGFDDAIKGDLTLGVRALQHYLLTEVECNFVKSY